MAEGRLARLFRAGRAYAVVSELIRDPDLAPTHEYERSPHSGAGNCVCGDAERGRLHPHEFMAGWQTPDSCTCGLPRDARCHR